MFVYNQQTAEYEYPLTKDLLIVVTKQAITELSDELYQDQRLLGLCPGIARRVAQRKALSVEAWLEIARTGDTNIFIRLVKP